MLNAINPLDYRPVMLNSQPFMPTLGMVDY
jgi:hypothetical protein